MSNKEQKTSFIGGLDKFRNADKTAGVKSARSSLEGTIEQYNQASEGLNEIDERIAEAKQQLKEARRVEKAEKRAAIVQMVDGALTAIPRATVAVLNGLIKHPKTTILPAIVLAVGVNVADKDDIIALTDSFPSMPKVSAVSPSLNDNSNDNNGVAIQVAALGSYSAAKKEANRLSKKYPSIEFNTSGNTVQSTSPCSDLVLNNVVESASKCRLGLALAQK